MNYMVCKWVGMENNAAKKATDDVNIAFNCIGGEIVFLWKNNKKIIRNLEELHMFIKLRNTITSSDNLIIQWPLYSVKPCRDLCFTKLPHRKLICFIQDIESYRYNPEDVEKLKEDIYFLNQFDVVISHNSAMSAFLRQNGLNTRIVDWEICDYLIEEPCGKQLNNDNYELCFIGNLQRSGFLYASSNHFQTHINLYGDNSGITLTPQLSYNGIYNPKSLSNELCGHFGLLWEGNSQRTCEGALGNYMRINNPNRLSLYLANNIPVITWKKAGLARFIEENGVGFTVDSLEEIDGILDQLNPEDYARILSATKSVGEKIRKGYFAQKAIAYAICEK